MEHSQSLAQRQLPKPGTPLDAHWFDLLVDGELSEGERRRLLLRLDQEPVQWRQCALAFLEAQAWQQVAGDCPSLADELAVETGEHIATKQIPAEPTVAPAPNSSSAFDRSHLLGFLFSLAASFVIAFGLGAWWKERLFTNATAPSNLAEQGSQQDSPDAPQNKPPSDIAVAGTHEQQPLEINRSQTPDPRDVRMASGEPREEILRFVEQGSDGTWREVQVPTVRGAQAEEWMREQPTLLPHSVKDMLERMGHQIRTRRELMPVELRDGQRAWVPIDQIEVSPAANPAYQ